MTFRSLLVDRIDHPLAYDLLALFLRIALAGPFFLSGRTKIAEGSWFTISDTTYTLFETEYAAVPLPAHFAAVAATVSEHLWPVLLVAGLATRLSAAALVGMTMVIQTFVYPDAWWNVHMGWVALGLAVLVLGPGRLSLDRWIFGRSRR